MDEQSIKAFLALILAEQQKTNQLLEQMATSKALPDPQEVAAQAAQAAQMLVQQMGLNQPPSRVYRPPAPVPAGAVRQSDGVKITGAADGTD